MSEFNTPMMKQYQDIKANYPDCLLLYRMGDFYELFLDDALIGSQILNITLTSRSKGKDGRVPMAGIPYHALDNYLAKLIQAGFKVAICEQLSPPNKYGLVERDVIRIVTPGTLMDENSLKQKENNYIISIDILNSKLAIAIADLSTGYFATNQIDFDNLEQTLKNELSKFHATECILPEHLYNNPEILKLLRIENGLNIFQFPDWKSFATKGKHFLTKHFKVKTLASFNLENKQLAINCCAALLGYLQQTQKSDLKHIKNIVSLEFDHHLIMDRSTIINLELFTTIREHNIRGSLYFILDQTVTPMGGRLLKQWLLKPLINKDRILQRYEVVNYFLNNRNDREEIRIKLKQIRDIERLISRLSVGLGNARDLINLKTSLKIVQEIKDLLVESKIKLIKNISKDISPKIDSVIDIIDQNIVDEPPILLKDGGLIKPKNHQEIDKLRNIIDNSKNLLIKLEQQERERTGISSLKIKFNQVFGFYIEISKANLHLVPDDYFRKQTLVNGERFITPELKKHEEIILTAEEKINQLEYEYYTKILNQILSFIVPLQEAAKAIATIDCLTSFAYLAEQEQYIQPEIVNTGEISIIASRHPVVEKLLEDSKFVPNDIFITDNQQLLLITGPNMAGKSVLIRQVALIVLMAQIGCYIPAQSAKLSIVDKIFVRSGASDVITSGLSTFMVEMVETAYILNNATKNSLIIMDEIGRGTSTYDGISIAWAIAEYLVTNKHHTKTLFATHYHELQALEDKYPNEIKNYQMAIENVNGEPIFLHTLISGGSSHSFGIAVAKLAGLPNQVLEQAIKLLQDLEKRDHKSAAVDISNQINPQSLIEHLIYKELEDIDISQTTPLEALNKLAQLKDKLKVFQNKSLQYLEAD